MKILHISPTYAPVLGGAELHMEALSEGLASRGHDVTVLTANARNLLDLFRGIHGRQVEIETLIPKLAVEAFGPVCPAE